MIQTLKNLNLKHTEGYPLPYAKSLISCGFPSPADDSLEEPLNIMEMMVENPVSTFYVRVTGDSMKDDGINEGDILVVDRSMTPKKGDIIVAIYDGDFTVKRLTKKSGKYYLIPANTNYSPLEITVDSGFEVWGVVRYCISRKI